ncbi:hypothetical protein EDB83DRAFT_2314644 [Lactarius deliciosus]|nr:hypothetical protein EDB83DRAFT_2314644 [Lactarius deliciosus]
MNGKPSKKPSVHIARESDKARESNSWKVRTSARARPPSAGNLGRLRKTRCITRRIQKLGGRKLGGMVGPEADKGSAFSYNGIVDEFEIHHVRVTLWSTFEVFRFHKMIASVCVIFLGSKGVGKKPGRHHIETEPYKQRIDPPPACTPFRKLASRRRHSASGVTQGQAQRTMLGSIPVDWRCTLLLEQSMVGMRLYPGRTRAFRYRLHLARPLVAHVGEIFEMPDHGIDYFFLSKRRQPAAGDVPVNLDEYGLYSFRPVHSALRQERTNILRQTELQNVMAHGHSDLGLAI